jgi:hypothetical protein
MSAPYDHRTTDDLHLLGARESFLLAGMFARHVCGDPMGNASCDLVESSAATE